MKSFRKLLTDHITAMDSHLCVGLDINPEGLGNSNSRLSDLIRHSLKVIDATRNIAVCYKPNFAFFERWGSDGFKWLEQVMKYIGRDNIVIADAKRGDIGNTADQYAISIFDHFGFDAVTLSPYMGSDSIKPFLKNPAKGAFILCRTSNPSASELQNLNIEDINLYSKVAKLAIDLNTNDNIGLVVGATNPNEIRSVRKTAPNLPFLIPGVGTQGGDLKKSMRYGNHNGQAIINISRSINFAGDLSESAIKKTAMGYVTQMREIIHE